MKYLGKY